MWRWHTSGLSQLGACRRGWRWGGSWKWSLVENCYHRWAGAPYRHAAHSAIRACHISWRWALVWIYFSGLIHVLFLFTMSLPSFLLLWFHRLLRRWSECHHRVFSMLFAWQQLCRLPLYHGKPFPVSSWLWYFMYTEILNTVCLLGYTIFCIYNSRDGSAGCKKSDVIILMHLLQ